MTLTSDRSGEATGSEPVRRGRMTPEVVRQADFPRSQLGRRGYNEADVERFRNRMVLELVNSAAEKAELRQEIQRLRDYYRRHGIDAERSTGVRQPRRRDGVPADVAPGVNAVNVMSQAQQAADQHIAQAEEQARRLVTSARAQYERILVEAHEQAEKAAADARAAEEQRVQVQVQALARRADRDPDGDPDSRPDPRVERLDPAEAANLRELAARLTYMRTFAQVTQVQLRSILDALSDELDHFAPTG